MPDTEAAFEDEATESKPLVSYFSNGNGAHASGYDADDSNRGGIIKILKRHGMTILIALVVILFFVTRSTGSSGANVVLTPRSDGAASNEDGYSASPMYRPICLTHNRRQSARILQTSMTIPSQQWAHIPCYSESTESLKWMFGSKTQVPLNTFGAPDAILKTNLSNTVFSSRSTPILGFGGAFTEASALNYDKLSSKGKESMMELLFGKSGLGYSIGRVHINSCDFSIGSYSYDDVDGDFALENFDISHDVTVGMVDMILRASKVFETAYPDENDFKMYASPWSPPAWMKAPTWDDDPSAEHASGMTGSAQPTCLREGVGPTSRYAKAWALYFSKFISAYQKLGVPLWAITVQNEPEFPAPWEACSYTPITQADFVANHLGPQLEEDHPDVKIFMFDHNKDHVITWAKTLLNATQPSAKYIDGTAYHWYAGGMDRLLDGAVGAPNMHRLQTTLDKLGVKKDHIVLGSESCHCPTTGYAGGDIAIYWARAERYAHTILSDLAAGSNGWVEWNLILDSIGGPNHLGNLCDAAILSVPHRAINGSDIPPTMDFEKAGHPFGRNNGDGRTREELNALGFPAKFLDDGIAVQPIYFYMGHISRYVRPGSRAVSALVEQSRETPGYRIFRPEGQVVAGGGMNDLARNGIELTAWPCEGSTRQQFIWNDKSQIEVFGHDWLGKPTTSCVGRKVDKDFVGLVMTDCSEHFGTYNMIPSTERDDLVKFVLTNGNVSLPEQCMILKPLRNEGGAYGPRGGAQASLGPCDAAEALWNYSDVTGEISSMSLDAGEVCLTTGWPFLQMGAFDTPNGESEKTVVILNEANQAANYALLDEDEVVLSGSIPPRSIQTVLLDYN